MSGAVRGMTFGWRRELLPPSDAGEGVNGRAWRRKVWSEPEIFT